MSAVRYGQRQQNVLKIDIKRTQESDTKRKYIYETTLLIIKPHDAVP
jgi:hypothetical protein